MDPALIIPTNEDVEKYFAEKNKLKTPLSSARFPPQLENYIYYKNVSLREILRLAFGSIANLPTKSAVYLAIDYAPRKSVELRDRVNDLLEEPQGSEERIGVELVDVYLDSAFLKISQQTEQGREFHPTRLIEPILTITPWSKPYHRYSKTLDGFLMDPFAWLGIEISSSLNPQVRSGYKIFGVANTVEETTKHETILLNLYWLEKHGGEGTIKDFVKESRGLKEPQDSCEICRYASGLLRQALTRTATSGIIFLNEKEGTFKLTPAGRTVLAQIDPLLEAIGWHETILKNNDELTYTMLEQEVQPDIQALWSYRRGAFDDQLSTGRGYETFLGKLKAARNKHREDSSRMH